MAMSPFRNGVRRMTHPITMGEACEAYDQDEATIREMVADHILEDWSLLPRGGGVYLIEGCGLIKIGIASGLAERLAALQACSPVPLRLVMFFWESDHVERRRMELALHAEFAEYRRHGEWFDLPDDWRDTARSTYWKNEE